MSAFEYNRITDCWESGIGLRFTIPDGEEDVQSLPVLMQLDGLPFNCPSLLDAFEKFGLNQEEARQILAGQIDDQLTYCRGTEEYRYTNGCFLTDGALRFAKKAGAYWLLDLIASVQWNVRACTKEDRQFWRIVRKKGTTEADVFCWDGNMSDERNAKVWACPTNLDAWRGHLHYHQHIEYTDLVHDEFTLYAFNGGLSPDGPVQRIIMLPSEN